MIFSPSLKPYGDDDAAWRFLFRDGRLLVSAETGTVPQLTAETVDALSVSEQIFVGVLDSTPVYTADVGETAEPPPDLTWQSLRAMLAHADLALGACASRAAQLVRWNREHRYCGRCGNATMQRGHERARECPGCALVSYPRITPAIMALVMRGREMLLARSARFPGGMFSALAGFVEAGESLEDTLAREVREEVGLEVANLRYFGSQSWPFPNSLMVAFVCDYAGGELKLEEAEIAEANWFDANALPTIPPTFSVAGRLIRSVAKQLGGTPAA